ncbi:MAG: hypothetical protein IJZ00_01685 [Lachnospiraceae bacterium]|nr:hypothetical protein [Lachnospiraceae bacterium]
MRVRNVIAIALCLMLFAAMALGSGSDSGSSSGDEREIVSASDAGSDEDRQSNSDVLEDNETADEEQVEESVAPVTIEEQVLVDQDGILIKATEYVVDDIWGDGIKLYIENNSDKTVTISCVALIVNNFMITDLFVSEVSPGNRANEVMNLSNSQLEAAGIESVGQVEIYFHVYDSTTYDTVFDSECITIQTSEYANMDTTPDDGGVELYNEGGIRIVGKTVDEDSFWGSAILLYCENNSGSNVGITVEEMSINGYMMTAYFSSTVYDGKMSMDTITILSSELEENGIETIEEVELRFHIYDADSYSTITDSDYITFSAE